MKIPNMNSEFLHLILHIFATLLTNNLKRTNCIDSDDSNIHYMESDKTEAEERIKKEGKQGEFFNFVFKNSKLKFSSQNFTTKMAKNSNYVRAYRGTIPRTWGKLDFRRNFSPGVDIFRIFWWCWIAQKILPDLFRIFTGGCGFLGLVVTNYWLENFKKRLSILSRKPKNVPQNKKVECLHTAYIFALSHPFLRLIIRKKIAPSLVYFLDRGRG